MENTSNGCRERLRFTTQVNAAPPAAPAAPPMPTTVEIAVDGNMSLGVEKRLADHPLMRRGCQRDQQRCRPGILREDRTHMWNEYQWKH